MTTSSADAPGTGSSLVKKYPRPRQDVGRIAQLDTRDHRHLIVAVKDVAMTVAQKGLHRQQLVWRDLRTEPERLKHVLHPAIRGARC